MEYISSAGLRIILRLIKSKRSVKMINVSPEVYEVFEVTGFTEMMTVEKAFRGGKAHRRAWGLYGEEKHG